MLTELCQELRNWFDRDRDKWFGDVRITSGGITVDDALIPMVEGQYYRIVGSLLNDGVHKWDDELIPESPFYGSVWSMAIPPTVIQLADDIAAWQAKYGTVDSVAMSPFNSESFGGYSYSKSGGGSGSGGSGASGDWRSAFASRLNRWRKI